MSDENARSCCSFPCSLRKPLCPRFSGLSISSICRVDDAGASPDGSPSMTFHTLSSVKLKVYAARLDITRLLRGVEVAASTAHSSVRPWRDWRRLGRSGRLTTRWPCQQSEGSRCLDPLRFCCVGDDRLNRIDELIQSKRLVQHRFRVQAFASRLDDGVPRVITKTSHQNQWDDF